MLQHGNMTESKSLNSHALSPVCHKSIQYVGVSLDKFFNLLHCLTATCQHLVECLHDMQLNRATAATLNGTPSEKRVEIAAPLCVPRL